MAEAKDVLIEMDYLCGETYHRTVFRKYALGCTKNFSTDLTYPRILYNSDS